jgi:hypothetical protein
VEKPAEYYMSLLLGFRQPNANFLYLILESEAALEMVEFHYGTGNQRKAINDACDSIRAKGNAVEPVAMVSQGDSGVKWDLIPDLQKDSDLRARVAPYVKQNFGVA